MMIENSDSRNSSLTRGAFWTSVVFYGLIALEFFYMVSPFAAYIYSVYGPGLDWLKLSGTTGRLVGFFMPHIARETTSFLITWHESIGAVFLSIGIAGFVAGAIQIYGSQLKRKGAVVGGVYRKIRHPQYLALMTAGFGMLLIWPRYLVVFGFVTVCFAYYLLARMEERICRKKFPGYDEYCKKTGMFLPIQLKRLPFGYAPPSSRMARAIVLTGFYICILLLAFGAARMIHNHSVSSLYTYSTDSEVYLSIGRLDPETIAELAGIATSDPEVRERLHDYSGESARFINYLMPADIYISEVPMYIPEGERTGHRIPSREDQSCYKIIFTRAEFGGERTADGLNILRYALNKTPLFEVRLDGGLRTVEQVVDPPERDIYKGVPVPVF